MAAVRDLHGPAADHAVRLEIAPRDGASVLLDVRRDRRAELTAVERVRPLRREHLERAREIRGDEPVARHEPRALAVHGSALGRVPQDRVEQRVEQRLRLRHHDALPRELDRRRDELLPRQRAVRPMRGREPGDGARHRARRMPDEEALRRLRALEGNVDRVHLALSPSRPPLTRRGDEEVEQPPRAVVRPVDEHEAAGSRPVSGLSATHDANAAAMQASTALPPSSSARAPACAVISCPAATAPLMRTAS